MVTRSRIDTRPLPAFPGSGHGDQRGPDADGGTLFLDEIGNMPPSLQIKLLRVLEEREFERLGSNQSVRVDVRIIAATNSHLLEKVEKRDFRTDLFYRLNVVPIHLPSLRERTEGLPLLANHFFKLVAKEYDLPEKKLTLEALKRLLHYPWPGNIRELRNVLELASVLSGERTILELDDFSVLAQKSSTPDGILLNSYPELPDEGIDLNQVVSDLEKNLICQSLKRTQGNKGKAARLLYLKPTTLVEKLRRMNLLQEFSP